jgi:hypothetical protein
VRLKHGEPAAEALVLLDRPARTPAAMLKRRDGVVD